MATIQKRNNSYKITVSCGYDINNKQIRRTMTYTPEPDMTPKQIEKEVQRQAVLFEENQGEYATGHAPNYCKVYVKTDENWHNEVKNVRITGLYQDGLTGEAE